MGGSPRGQIIRAFIVADIRLYREGLAQVLQQDGRITVVGTAASVGVALSELAALQPHVLLLDMVSPNALAGVGAITDAFPGVQVVALGVAETEKDVVACAEAGVAGYVPRDGSVEDLVAAVESAGRREFQCSPRVAATLVRRVARLAAERDAWPEGARLTTRELEVLYLIDEGLSNKQIASQLFIEVATVKNHVHNILAKLHARTRGEAAARMRHGRQYRRRTRERTVHE